MRVKPEAAQPVNATRNVRAILAILPTKTPTQHFAGNGRDGQPNQNGLSISLTCFVPQMLTSSTKQSSGTSMQCTSVRANSSALG